MFKKKKIEKNNDSGHGMAINITMQSGSSHHFNIKNGKEYDDMAKIIKEEEYIDIIGENDSFRKVFKLRCSMIESTCLISVKESK